VARLEASLLRVVIQVEAQAPGDTLNVLVDGTPLPKSVWGEAAPLYPGQHEVRAKATDRRTWAAEFQVNAEHVPTVTVPTLEPVATAPDVTAEAVARRTEAPARNGSARRTAAIILGGTGVAALGVMAGFGLTAIATYQSCAEGACLKTPQHTAQVNSHNDATVSTVAGIAGGAALAGAAIVWFTGPSRRNAFAFQLALTGRGASLQGVW
jgi:hypothetical protein